MKLKTLIAVLSMMCITETYAQNFDERFKAAGFVDVATVSPDIKVELMYDRADNFTGVVLYDGLSKAYLHPDAARALGEAQKKLSETAPGFSLFIKDAARPMSIQRRMFDAVRGTSKANYVANPAKGGGLHNYGMAVDVTIVDPAGRELPMGTPVDHLGREANIDREGEFVRTGVISETERQNRLLLRRVMTSAGFKPLRTEWWHFNFITMDQARKSHKRLDF